MIITLRRQIKWNYVLWTTTIATYCTLPSPIQSLTRQQKLLKWHGPFPCLTYLFQPSFQALRFNSHHIIPNYCHLLSHLLLLFPDYSLSLSLRLLMISSFTGIYMMGWIPHPTTFLAAAKSPNALSLSYFSHLTSLPHSRLIPISIIILSSLIPCPFLLYLLLI